MTDELRDLAIRAAEAAARAIREAVASGGVEVALKSARHDLVTTADRAAERAIIDAIRRERPNDRIHAEESGEHSGTSNVEWLVDPPDGTTNFVHHRSDYAVSIAAIADDGQELAAVIHRPADAQWVAVSPLGAAGTFTLGTTALTDASAALISVGFPHDASMRPAALEALGRSMPAVRDFRRTGSAACDLLAVATGTLDAYVGFNLAPWDYAAGHALVRAAGGHAGVVQLPSGLTAVIGAATELLHTQLVASLRA